MKISLTTLSPVLLGSGEGGALVNVDLAVHDSGIPFVPGRRLKGLLKESLMEVLEMFGREDPALVEALFGKGGKAGPKGKLRFPNLYLADWTELLKELKELKAADQTTYHPHNLRNHFTQEIPQTAIENGTAKKGSLRVYRTLNPNLTFEGKLEGCQLLTDEEKTYLEYAATNLRAAGTRRNKGFGDVEVRLKEGGGEFETERLDPEESSSSLLVRIECLEPVVIPSESSDQNTLGTRRFFPGRVIRGMLAAKLIKEKSLGSTAHTDDFFHAAILSGKLAYGPCFIAGSLPIPMNFCQPKGKQTEVISDSFTGTPKDVKLRPINGFGKILEENGTMILEMARVRTNFMFHNSRPNRTAGRLTGDASEIGGIFYYESIAAGQVFEGRIEGEPALLKELAEAVRSGFVTRMGRSKSAQYGKVRVTLSWQEEEDQDFQAKLVDMVCLSPLLLLDELGQSAPTKAALLAALNEGGGSPIAIDQMEVKFQLVESFNSIWLSKTEQEQAFATGSVFRLKVTDGGHARLLQLAKSGLGARRLEGFGQVALQKIGAIPKCIKERERQDGDAKAKKLPQNVHLKAFQMKMNEKEKEVESRRLAIRDASSLSPNRMGSVKNSLLSRLLALLEEMPKDNRTDLLAKWKEKMSAIEGRAAGKALQDADLWDAIRKLGPLKKVGGEGPDPYIYWKTLLETMRLKNKQYATE